MTFSVFNYQTQLYDYYEGGSRNGTHATAPPRAPLRHAIGATTEGAAWSLPVGCKKVGSGPLPRGRIASTGIHLGSLGDLAADLPRYAIVAAVAYVAWRALR